MFASLATAECRTLSTVFNSTVAVLVVAVVLIVAAVATIAHVANTHVSAVGVIPLSGCAAFQAQVLCRPFPTFLPHHFPLLSTLLSLAQMVTLQSVRDLVYASSGQLTEYNTTRTAMLIEVAKFESTFNQFLTSLAADLPSTVRTLPGANLQRPHSACNCARHRCPPQRSRCTLSGSGWTGTR